MIPLTLKEIAEATGGQVDGGDPDALVSSVVTDSRRVTPGSLFVALVGENADGNDFVRSAALSGAVASLVAAARAPENAGALVRVPDPLRALAAIAEAVRTRLGATVVGITGSSGKTCTKELTAAAVGTEMRTLASEANFNNEIGVPLTILAADERTEALVVEVGARMVGDIEALMPVVRPDVAVVTNVGPAHVGIFGSLANIAHAKGELVEALGHYGVAVLNADDPAVFAMAARVRGSVITFGLGPDAAVRAEDIVLDTDARASFAIVSPAERAPVSLQTPGEHMVPNALAAAAAALAAGVSLEAAAVGLSHCEGAPMRMQLIKAADRTIINDAYNANPDSTAAALKALMTMAHGRPTWAVLGRMAELGETTPEEHDRVGRLAAKLGVAHVLTVGEEARAVHDAAADETAAVFAATVEEALEVLRAHLEPDAIVLVKGSRAAELERVVEGLLS